MIERLYVHNYRCFENFTIDFVGGPSSLIIGKNGTGKSTLRHALSIFQAICRGTTRVKNLISRNDFAYYRTHIPIRLEIALALGGKRFKYMLAFDFPENFLEARIAEEMLEVDGTVIYSRRLGEVTQPGGTPFGVDWHLVGLPVLNVRDRLGERFREQIMSYFATMVLIAPIPAKMAGYAEEESFEIDGDASNFSAWLNGLTSRYPAAYGVLDTYLRFMLPDLESFEREPRGERGKQLVLKFAKPEFDKPFKIDFAQLSDGEKCFFLSALIVAANKMSPVVCCWDEPDSHLSLPEVGHFITQLRKMTNHHGQFIASSHHPEVIRRFSDETTIVLTRKSHLEPPVVQTLADYHYSGDLIEALVRDEVIG